MINKSEHEIYVEQKLPLETERKYLHPSPERIAHFRELAWPIEQLYLSHPTEPFSLRLRASWRHGSPRYTAALKDMGRLGEHGLERLEVETSISSETYAYYRSLDVPVLRKLRAEPIPAVSVDFFDHGLVLMESEDPMAWQQLLNGHDLVGIIDVTGEPLADNEHIAHRLYQQEHDGREALRPMAELDLAEMVDDIIHSRPTDRPTVIQLAGRSGSGKSTLVAQLHTALTAENLTSVAVSTDDYHRGKRWLEQYKGGPWTDWDAPIVYDTAALASDLMRLKRGESVPCRSFDFQTEEPCLNGHMEPADVIIIEGIYARSPDLTPHYDRRYELPTPPATSMGRRLLRDARERPQFADPARSLRYMVENAEPSYRAQAVLPEQNS